MDDGMSVEQDVARDRAPIQDALFEDPNTPPSDGELIGYRGPTACSAAGITYRQLDYWARTGLVVPTIRSASGSGSQRLYSFKDILVLKVVKRLLDTGVSLQNIRTAVEHLRARGVEDLAAQQVTDLVVTLGGLRGAPGVVTQFAHGPRRAPRQRVEFRLGHPGGVGRIWEECLAF